MLEFVPKLTDFIFVVTQESRRKIVEEVVREFTEKVLRVSDDLEKGMIHGDFNEQNILLEKNEGGKWVIKAILDFGDSHYDCYLYEVAITMAYMMLHAKNLDAGGFVLAGYEARRVLTKQELDLLKVGVLLVAYL